ncbi:hypothetical protein CAPTEDRAFT_220926 [Capitella teleta]|uniref:Fibrosin-like 1 n=1 Tax=Capitella teleta TaxID=283909 RepID=R7TYS9_CAPTE|nr:hypothetical protein CAPTEDRAFT_220926 [Capitella teleta]|eukprot:ELT98777.1 hypothetical protein CAPTEDRAFT_220926 [Capitella teleta]
MAPGVSPPSAAAAAAAFSLRAEMHQHNHLHNHQHMHQHYGPLPPPNGPPAPPPPPPHLMQGLTAGYPGLGPLMHPGGLPPTPLGSGLQGAFQPKATVPTSMHHTQLLMSLDRQKTAAAAAAAAAASGVPPPPPSVSAGLKKPGKWCAAHVRIAWEIHLHQQKQQAESRSSSNSSSNDGPKSSADPLRPPSHLFPPSSNPLHRPGASSAASTADLISSSALLGVHGRNPYDAAGHYPFLTPGALGIPPFPRPAPYGNLTGLGSNAFGGLASVGNGPFGRPSELSAIPGLTPPQEWNRLRRTPPSFPTPPAWPKSEAERERDKERERSGSARPNSCNSGPLSRDKREGSRDRDVKDFARDREMKERQHRERIPSRGSPAAECRSLSIDQRSRDTKDMRHASRSRSRSPIVRNGPASSSGPTEHKAPSAPSAESMLFPVSSKHPSLPPPHEVRVKEERKDDVMVIEPKERPRPPDFGPAKVNADLMMANSKAGGMLHPGFAGLFSNPMLHEQQQRLLSSLYPHPATSTAAALAAAGLHHSQHAAPPPPPPPMWQHLELSQHRMELQREMEREKEHLLRRFGVSAEHERLREQQEMLLRQQQHNRLLAAEHHERATAAAAAAVEKDSEGSKLLPPPLRPADLYAATRGPPATHSPLHMHNSKSNSPACTVGAPPPLISSSLGGGGGGCGSAGSSHCNSPVIKTAAAAKTSPLHSNSQQQSEKDSSSSQQLSSANGHDAEQLQSR